MGHPMSVTVPSMRAMSNACTMSLGLPDHLEGWSAPRPPVRRDLLDRVTVGGVDGNGWRPPARVALRGRRTGRWR